MFEQIKYLVLDVDGTMTDAGIYYDSTGNEIKKFSRGTALDSWRREEQG